MEIRIDTIRLKGLLSRKQVRVAKEAGMNPYTLAQKLSGNIGWKVEDINKLAKAGEFSVSEFVSIG